MTPAAAALAAERPDSTELTDVRQSDWHRGKCPVALLGPFTQTGQSFGFSPSSVTLTEVAGRLSQGASFITLSPVIETQSNTM